MIVLYSKLSGLSNDRSYYLFDHMLFFAGNMRISVNEKEKESVMF